jgi:hypothetical protein
MGETLTASDYEPWFSPLFPSHDLGRIVLVAAGISIGLFVVGYAVATIGTLPYLTLSEAYLGAFGVFWMLVCLGVADTVYVDIWEDVRSAFAVDDETYHAVVEPHLANIHDTRRILGYTAALLVPYLVVVSVVYLPGSTLREPAVDMFLGGTTEYPPSVAGTLVFVLFGGANTLLFATICNGFVNHLELVRDVLELPFEDVYVSASDLEPVARFTIASATVWFAGVSLVVLWIHAGISGTVGIAFITVLVFTGAVLFLAPQLILHDALVDAKRTELATIRVEYREMYQQVTDEDVDEDVAQQLRLIDRRLESAKAIRTWVYNISSIGKLATAAILPWITLVQELVSTADLLLGS